MLNSQFFYVIGESFRGWKQYRSVIIPSLITIFLCSFLLIGSLIFLNALDKASDQDKDLYSIEAFLFDELKSLSPKSISEINSWKEVSHVEVITSDKALKEFSKEFGQEMLNLVNENPLPASIRVSLNDEFRNVYALSMIKQRLDQMAFFQEINSNLEIITWIESHKFNITFWPIIITLLLSVTLWMIIANSVRLTLFSRSLLVENMKYCGGSNMFIQLPFVLEGALQGFLGSVSAAISWGLMLWLLTKNISVLEGVIIHSGLIFGVVVLMVTLIGAYTSYRIVRDFLAREV